VLSDKNFTSWTRGYTRGNPRVYGMHEVILSLSIDQTRFLFYIVYKTYKLRNRGIIIVEPWPAAPAANRVVFVEGVGWCGHIDILNDKFRIFYDKIGWCRCRKIHLCANRPSPAPVLLLRNTTRRTIQRAILPYYITYMYARAPRQGQRTMAAKRGWSEKEYEINFSAEPRVHNKPTLPIYTVSYR